MNIAFFGSSLISAYWNGAATYYRGLLRALAARGHAITFYEPDAYDRRQHRDIDDPTWASVVIYPAEEHAATRAVEEASRTADLMVKASGVGVHDDLLEHLVLATRKPRSMVAFWDVDAPATLDRVAADPSDPFRRLIPGYDVIFTYGGGSPVVDAYSRLGARLCVPVYNALDPETHFPVAPEAAYAADLTFIGNRLPDREHRVREFFLKPAGMLSHRRFLLGGNGWSDCDLPPNVTALGHVYTAQHNAINSTALAVININRASMARYGFSPPTRIFEAAGAAACLISDQWDGIETFLTPGEEILVAADGGDVAAQLDALTPERGRALGAAARRRILAEHTYARRALQVEGVLEGVAPAMTAA